MSLSTFAFYVFIAYIIYYTVLISYDLLTSKSNINIDSDGGVQYDFGNVPVTKVATLDDNESGSGGIKQSFDSDERSTYQELKEENDLTKSVDLSLENITTNEVNIRSEKTGSTYKY
ncbi:MAG TPA: hypothetical protein VF610_01315 [Segetibacter sp.]|jgi:hypothetical protein